MMNSPSESRRICGTVALACVALTIAGCLRFAIVVVSLDAEGGVIRELLDKTTLQLEREHFVVASAPDGEPGPDGFRIFRRFEYESYPELSAVTRYHVERGTIEILFGEYAGNPRKPTTKFSGKARPIIKKVILSMEQEFDGHHAAVRRSGL